MAVQPEEANLPLGSNLKIGLFHLASGMSDVIATGVWNRIMISDLGFSATPIGLLVALRYFLAPIGVWAGQQSDRRTVFGFRRLFWIWLGRLLMVIGVATLGLQTAQLARGAPATALAWAVIAISLLMFSLGTALSGATFLALVYDRASEGQRGRAVGIVWTFLLLGFTIGGILFGVMLPTTPTEGAGGSLPFSPDTLQTLFIVAALLMGALWFFSLLGEEKRNKALPASQKAVTQRTSLREDLRLVWRNRQMRFFFWYLALSMAFAFSQDLILEPFGAEVFGMEPRITTRFTAYWGSMAILGTIVFLILGRRFKRLTNTTMNWIGVGTLLATFSLFAVASFAGQRWMVTPGLILLGIGLGVWNVGTLGMMTDMSPAGRAGTFLGFWTLTVTFARGIGVSGGGLLRDLGLSFTGANPSLAYGLVFTIGAVGLGVALYALSRVNVKAFKTATYEEVAAEHPADAKTVFAGGMD